MGRKSWWVRWHGRDAAVVRAEDVRADDRINRRTRLLGHEVDQWLADWSTRHVMVDLYQSLVGVFDPLTLLTAVGVVSSDAGRRRVMRERIVTAFRAGEVVLLMPVEAAVPATAPEGEDVSDDLLNPFDTWVEVELLDPDGAPIAGADYVVVTPDGATHTGTLDAQGRARVDSIGTPGACRIEFPGLLEPRWGLRNPP